MIKMIMIREKTMNFYLSFCYEITRRFFFKNFPCEKDLEYEKTN